MAKGLRRSGGSWLVFWSIMTTMMILPTAPGGRLHGLAQRAPGCASMVTAFVAFGLAMGCGPARRHANGAGAGTPGAAGATAGAPCSTAQDCASGICEGGCGAQGGVCAAGDRMCTMDATEYCGCDGQTFLASSSCPGRQFSAKGTCPGAPSLIAPPAPGPTAVPPVAGAAASPQGAAVPGRGAPDGSACTVAADCASNLCEGRGCNDRNGTCVAANRMCTRDLRSYCGCDGVTFAASGSCPGQRFAEANACRTAAPRAAK